MWAIIPFLIFSLTTTQQPDKPTVRGWGMNWYWGSYFLRLVDTSLDIGGLSKVDKQLYGVGMVTRLGFFSLLKGTWKWENNDVKKDAWQISYVLPVSARTDLEFAWNNEVDREKYWSVRVNVKFFASSSFSSFLSSAHTKKPPKFLKSVKKVFKNVLNFVPLIHRFK